MSKETDFVNGVTVVDESFLDAVQEVLTGLAHNFRLEKQSTTAVRVVAGASNSQASITIMGKMRYTTTTKSLTITGGANTYNIYATADTLDRDFALEQSSGASAATSYRKIGEVDWDGSAITDVRNLAGPAPTDDPTLTGTVTIPTPASGSDTKIAATTEWVRDRIADVTPATHATTHESGGSDEIDLGSLDGQLVSGQVPTGLITSTMIADGTITDTDVASANKDGSAGTASMRTLGTGSTQACAGNDGRLSNTRDPNAHASTHIRGASDEIDGDLIDVDFSPSNYTRTTGTPGSNAEHLAAHLRGIDTELGTIQRPSLVTSLPVSPSAGDEVYYQTTTMRTMGWAPLHLRYNGGYGDAYEWDVLGACSYRKSFVTGETLTSGSTWRNTATATANDVVVPLAGIYHGQISCDVSAPNGANDFRFGVAVGNTDPDADNFSVASNNTAGTQGSALACSFEITMTAGGTMRSRVYSNGATCTFRRRALVTWPVRVG